MRSMEGSGAANGRALTSPPLTTVFTYIILHRNYTQVATLKIPRMSMITLGVADPDGYYWEIAYGEMFDFDAQGDMRWKA